MNSNDTRKPEAIEADIQQTRSAIDDTLTAIEHKFTPGQMVDQAMAYFRDGPGEFGENLATSVKNNPLPVLLIGAGIAWLVTSNNRPPRSRDYSSSAELTYRGREAPVPGNMPARHAQTESSDGITDKLGDAAAAARRRAAAAGQSVSDTASGLRERGGQMGENARQQVGAMADSARESWDEWSAEASWRARQARKEARYQARRARRGFVHMLDEQPLVMGAIGLAVGAALGAALPATRQEDEWLGETRDEWLERAKTAGEEQLRRAERVAEAASNAAMEEAEEAGLTPKSGQESLEKTRDKLENVVEAAKDAAQREADAQDFNTPTYRGASEDSDHTTAGMAKSSGA